MFWMVRCWIKVLFEKPWRKNLVIPLLFQCLVWTSKCTYSGSRIQTCHGWKDLGMTSLTFGTKGKSRFFQFNACMCERGKGTKETMEGKSVRRCEKCYLLLFCLLFSYLFLYLLFFCPSSSIGVLGHAGDGFWTCLCLRLPVPFLFQVSTSSCYSYRLHAQRIGGRMNSCFCFFPKGFVWQL